MKENKQVLVCKNLKDFEGLLEESGFCRAHHSYMINLKHIQKYIKGDGGYVILTDQRRVDVSRRKMNFYVFLRSLSDCIIGSVGITYS